MIGLASAPPASAARPDCVRRLIERFTSCAIELPSTGGVPAWVDDVMSRVTTAEACAVAQHLFGVLPLIDRCFDGGCAELTPVASGVKLGALALFTPTAMHRWGVAALQGELLGHTVRVTGEVSVPSHDADGSIVPVLVSGDDYRLAWLDHVRPGVERHGCRNGAALNGGSLNGNATCWLDVHAIISAACLSRPVTHEPEDDLFRCLSGFTGIWALVALSHARRAVRALRHAVRTAGAGDRLDAFSTSQLVAMGITEVEIETELASAAARQLFAGEAAGSSGTLDESAACLSLALAAARALTAVSVRAGDLRDQLGLTLDARSSVASLSMLTAFVGGTFLLEHELDRAMRGRTSSGEAARATMP